MEFDIKKVIFDVADPKVDLLIGKEVITGTRLIDLKDHVIAEECIEVLEGVDTTHNYFLLKSGKIASTIYPANGEEVQVKYRPFTGRGEMIAKADKVIPSNRHDFTQPLIWLKYKGTWNAYLVTGILESGIMLNEFFTWEEAFKKLEFLNETPFGERA
jgi:hypothetical protein